MTLVRRRLGDYVNSRWLNSTDVIGHEGAAVVTHVGEEEVRDDKRPGGKRLAFLVTFDRWPDKALDLNVTNIRAFQDMFGEDVEPDQLRGARVFVTTQHTNFGRGVLIQPVQDSMQHASAAARQAIADSMARQGLEPRAPAPGSIGSAPPLPTRAEATPVMATHLHQPGESCPPNCPVAAAVARGDNVYEQYPAPFVRPSDGLLDGPGTADHSAPGEYDAQDPGAQEGGNFGQR